jgi:AcrR family transcriptional regulator
MDNDLSPKERILAAATDLFAEKGYATVGVRAIAERAGVNSAMINYYFGSKVKLLEAIIESLFESYRAAVASSLGNEVESVEERIRSYFKRAIVMARRQQKLLRIMLTQLPFDRPEIAEFKARQVREVMLPMVRSFMESAGQINPALRSELVGPAIHGMLMFHFLTAPVMTRVMDVELDDAFYEQYAAQLTELVLYGLVGRTG